VISLSEDKSIPRRAVSPYIDSSITALFPNEMSFIPVYCILLITIIAAETLFRSITHRTGFSQYQIMSNSRRRQDDCSITVIAVDKKSICLSLILLYVNLFLNSCDCWVHSLVSIL